MHTLGRRGAPVEREMAALSPRSLAVAAFLGQSDASAAGPDPASVSILVRVSAPERARGERIAAALGEYPVPPGIRLEVAPVDTAATPPGAMERRCRAATRDTRRDAVLWVVLEERAYGVYACERDSPWFGVRRSEGALASEAILQEEVVNVAVSTLALLAEGPGPAPSSPEVTPAPRVERAPRWPWLWFAASYAGRSFAREIPWQHGVGLRVSVHPHPAWAVGLGGDVVLPAEHRAAGARLELLGIPVGPFVAYHFRVHPRVDVALEAHAHVEPIRRRSWSIEGMLEATPPRWQVASQAGLGVGLGVHPHPRVRLFVQVGADTSITRTRYTVDEGDRTTSVVTPDPVRAYVRAGVAVGTVRRGAPRSRARPGEKE